MNAHTTALARTREDRDQDRLPLETLPDFSRTLGNVTGDVGVAAWAGRWRAASGGEARAME